MKNDSCNKIKKLKRLKKLENRIKPVFGMLIKKKDKLHVFLLDRIVLERLEIIQNLWLSLLKPIHSARD